MNVIAAIQSLSRKPLDKRSWKLTASELGASLGGLTDSEASELAIAFAKTELEDEQEWFSGARTMLLNVLEGIRQTRVSERVEAVNEKEK